MTNTTVLCASDGLSAFANYDLLIDDFSPGTAFAFNIIGWCSFAVASLFILVSAYKSGGLQDKMNLLQSAYYIPLSALFWVSKYAVLFTSDGERGWVVFLFILHLLHTIAGIGLTLFCISSIYEGTAATIFTTRRLQPLTEINVPARMASYTKRMQSTSMTQPSVVKTDASTAWNVFTSASFFSLMSMSASPASSMSPYEDESALRTPRSIAANIVKVGSIPVFGGSMPVDGTSVIRIRSTDGSSGFRKNMTGLIEAVAAFYESNEIGPRPADAETITIIDDHTAEVPLHCLIFNLAEFLAMIRKPNVTVAVLQK